MRRLNLLIAFIQVFCLSFVSIKSNELSEPNSEIETSEDSNNPSFQFPPAHSTLQKYPLIDDKRELSFDSESLVSSIRRFPQYPSSQHYPVNSDGSLLQRQPQVISVLSGGGSPHQSVSWNPPATNAPPSLRTSSFTGRQEIPTHRDSSDNSRFFQPVPVHPAGFASNINSDSRFLSTGSILASPNSFKPSSSVDGHSLENSRNVASASGLSAGSVVLPSAASSSPSSSSSSSASVGSSSSLPASSASAAAGSNAPKKDDVVIYYYYYYDEEDGKNTTVKVTSNLDTIPSLEQFDSPEVNKPDKALRVNNDHIINKPPVDTSKDDEVVAPFRGYVNHFDHSSGLANRPTTPPPPPSLPVLNLNHFQSRPVSTLKPVQPTSPPSSIKPSTDVSISVSLPGDGSNDPVSNVFRYGSSVGPRPTFDSVRVGPFSGVGARGTAFQPQFPGQGFRHIPSASTVAPITHSFPSSDAASAFSHPTHSSNLQGSNQPILHHGHIVPVSQPNQPNFGVNLNIGEIKPQSSAATVPSTLPSTLAATLPSTSITTSTTTTTTTTTTTSTTTTTTPEPTTASPAAEETTTAAARGRPSFGSRRRFGANNRPNPLSRLRTASSSAPQTSSSTSTTTTSTTARPRNRNFGSSLRRPNRLLTPQRKPENEKKEEPGHVTRFTTSSTSAPSLASSVSTTTVSSRRFGSSVNRGRFGATSRGSTSRTTSSTSPSSTSSSALSSTSAPVSTSPLATGARTPSRRPTSLLANRGRQRPSFFRSRNKPAEEVTEMPKAETETELAVSESPSSSSISSTAPASSTESMTHEPVSSPAPKKVETVEEKETSESLTPVSSTTEKSLFNRPRNRNPLFRNRPRPNIFGSRRTNSE